MTPFIDSHVHVMPDWRLKGLARWILRAFPDHPVKESVSAEDILTDLKKMKITHFFNFIYPLKAQETDSLNAFNIKFCHDTPGAIPFASLHQDTPDKARLAETLFTKHDLVGMKFHPFVQRFDPWDQRMNPLYEFMQEIGKPVFLHTGFEDFYSMKMPIKELVALVKRFPRLPLVFVHMAFPGTTTCFELLQDYPGLYLDATNVLAFFRPEFKAWVDSMPNGHQLVDELIEGLEQHCDRIMFGSDHPVGMGGLPEIHDDFENLPISKTAKQAIRTTTPVKFVNQYLPGFDWERSLC
ncbi:amidohydrolase [bacterium]|nr:amidohydrolase [bacterium]